MSIRRNHSSFSLKKIPESSKILLQEKAGSRQGEQKEIAKVATPTPFSKDSCVKQRDGSILHVSENDREVLVMEMVSGKLVVIAATAEKLFLKLADETTQGTVPD